LASRLRLTAIRDQLGSLLNEAARKELTLREAVRFLCERKIARREDRRIEMASKIAHFPTGRELDRVRLHGAALGRSAADPRTRRLPLGRPRRCFAAAGSRSVTINQRRRRSSSQGSHQLSTHGRQDPRSASSSRFMSGRQTVWIGAESSGRTVGRMIGGLGCTKITRH
jgi:hypothetical protein